MGRQTTSLAATSAAWLLPAAVLFLGCLIRAAQVLRSSFPLGDGGLFFLMVKALQHAHYLLPVTVAYNGRALPFAYPPLGFYLTGSLSSLAGIPALTAMRVVPLALSILTLGAVAMLATAVLPSRTQVLGAIFAFSTLPLAYRYFLMGAGITRAPGLLFAVLTVWQAYLLYTRPRPRYILLTSIFAALTILSHPNATWFAAESVVLLLLFFGRNRKAVLHSAAVLGGALVLTMPWWLLVVHRHGLTPFLSASQSGSPEEPAWLLLLKLQVTAEPLYPILMTGAVIGVLCCLRDRRYWLPVWLVASCVLDSRYSGTFAMVPLALLAGVGVGGLLELSRWVGSEKRANRLHPGIAAVMGWAALLAFSTDIAAPGPAVQALPSQQRTAMAWVRSHIAPDSRFLVVDPAGASASSDSEWFPVLSGSISLAAYQGTEWLKRAPGPSPWARYDRLQACGTANASCLDNWGRRFAQSFQYVYVRTESTFPLRWDLMHSTRYRLLYHNKGVLIFAHQSRSL